MCREYPRPNADAVYTPELDDYIAALVQGAKATDKENRILQDKVLDITGPLCLMFEHLNAMINSNSPAKDLTQSQDEVKTLLQTVSYSIRLVRNVSSFMSATLRSAILNKINSQGTLASLGKDYPKAGRKLFGAGLEERLKARAETAKILMTASSVGRSNSQNRFSYRSTSRPFRSSPYRGRGANRFFRNRGSRRFQSRGQPTTPRGRGQQWTSQTTTT